jgi:hypothetical protein
MAELLALGRYRREAERLRSLAAGASFIWARDAFREAAQEYDQLADTAEREGLSSMPKNHFISPTVTL